MGHRPAVDAGREQLEDERVVLGGGQDGDRRLVGGDAGAGDVDALAAGLRDHRLGALDRASLERCGEVHGAVVAGVGGEGDDHAMLDDLDACGGEGAALRRRPRRRRR